MTPGLPDPYTKIFCDMDEYEENRKQWENLIFNHINKSAEIFGFNLFGYRISINKWCKFIIVNPLFKNFLKKRISTNGRGRYWLRYNKYWISKQNIVKVVEDLKSSKDICRRDLTQKIAFKIISTDNFQMSTPTASNTWVDYNQIL